MAEAKWTDIEKRKLEERLRVLEAQVRRTAREADARSTGAKFTIREPSTQIDGNVNIDGTLDVTGQITGDGGAAITDPLLLYGGVSNAEIRFTNAAGRNRASIQPAGTVDYDDLLVQAGATTGLPGRLYLIGQSLTAAYLVQFKLDSYNSLAELKVTDAGGTGKIGLTSSGTQLNGAGATVTEFSTDGTMGGNSDTALPTEKAVKTYVDGRTSGLEFVRADKDSDGDYDPLTSTSWDGDSFSTGTGTINWNTAFGVPAGAAAVAIQVQARDSGSSGAAVVIKFAAKSTTTNPSMRVGFRGIPDDIIYSDHGIVPISAAGTSYYDIVATGASTMDIWVYVVGWFI